MLVVTVGHKEKANSDINAPPSPELLVHFTVGDRGARIPIGTTPAKVMAEDSCCLLC